MGEQMENPMKPMLLGEAQTALILHLIKSILREVGMCRSSLRRARFL